MAVHVLDIGPLGSLIQVGLRVGAAFEAAGLGNAPRSCPALIDTGATTTAIDPNVLQALRPQLIGRPPVMRPGAAPRHGLSYDVRLKFEHHLTPGRWFDLEVIQATPATPGVDVLIGLDLLLKLTLISNGPLGKLVLMY
jgi:hypothetical protein